MARCINCVLAPFGLRLDRVEKSDAITFDGVWEKCLKHRQVLDELPEMRTKIPEHKPVKRIWQLWWQGIEAAPVIVRRCMESVAESCPDYEINVLSGDDYMQYVDVPADILRKIERGGEVAHISDYIRIALLAKYGGVWIDATIFMTDNIPDDIVDSMFFAPVLPYWAILGVVPSIEMELALSRMAYPCNNGLAFTNWMIAARRDSSIIAAIKLLLEKYWEIEDSAVDYLFFQYLSTMSVVANEYCRAEYIAMPKYDTTRSNILQQCLLRPYDDQLMDEIRSLTPIHKLTYKLPHGYQSGDGSFLDKILSGGVG